MASWGGARVEPIAALATPQRQRGCRRAAAPLAAGRPAIVPRAAAAAGAGPAGAGSVARDVLICTHKTCRKDGSRQVAQVLADLAPPGITVREVGCLGECGKGPNVALNPSGTIVHFCSTPAAAARLLEDHCGARDTASALRELTAVAELRERGNAALEAGDAVGAVGLYTEALQSYPHRAPQLLLANRSAARLRQGDAAGALEDARAAEAAAPGWHKAPLRVADALDALGDARGALEACGRAEAAEAALRKSPGHVIFVRSLRQRVAELVVS